MQRAAIIFLLTSLVILGVQYSSSLNELEELGHNHSLCENNDEAFKKQFKEISGKLAISEFENNELLEKMFLLLIAFMGPGEELEQLKETLTKRLINTKEKTVVRTEEVIVEKEVERVQEVCTAKEARRVVSKLDQKKYNSAQFFKLDSVREDLENSFPLQEELIKKFKKTYFAQNRKRPEETFQLVIDNQMEYKGKFWEGKLTIKLTSNTSKAALIDIKQEGVNTNLLMNQFRQFQFFIESNLYVIQISGRSLNRGMLYRYNSQKNLEPIGPLEIN